MRILALITARGGSKRLPGKNVRLLGGRPLIEWTIDVAGGIPEVCDTLVSTDDSAIARIASDAGASVPWLRPAELATDTATSVSVCLHALDWYENAKGKVDALMLLQPTSPFRRRATVRQGIDLFQKHGGRPVIAVSPAASHPQWCVRIEHDSVRPFIEAPAIATRSQDLPPAYVFNGAFYLVGADDLRARQAFYWEDMVPLVIPAPEESLDIDDEWDWMMAEAILAKVGGAPR